MSNNARWRSGDTNPVLFAVDSATVIEVGDLVYLDTDDIKSASLYTDQLTLAANQEAFHDVFAGVALEASASGQTTPISVATTGVFKFACASATHEIGDLIGSVEQANGTALENQKVVKVATANLSIGRCAKRETNISVLVNILSTVMYGGPQVIQ